MTLAAFNTALLDGGCGGTVGAGTKRRNDALIACAKSATSLIFRNGTLLVPPDLRSFTEDFPNIHIILANIFKLEINDAFVISSADTSIKAEYCALTAALNTMNILSKT